MTWHGNSPWESCVWDVTVSRFNTVSRWQQLNKSHLCPLSPALESIVSQQLITEDSPTFPDNRLWWSGSTLSLSLSESRNISRWASGKACVRLSFIIGSGTDFYVWYFVVGVVVVFMCHVNLWRLEENFMESFSSFHLYVGFGDWIWATGILCKCACPDEPLTGLENSP